MVKREQIARLQYITRYENKQDILIEVEQFLNGGGRWLQLRMKGASEEYFLETAVEVCCKCREYGATFIVNDNPNVVLKCGADGVHIGKGDMSVEEVRSILGDDAIIGRTANTIEDIRELASKDIDYIGLGPYKWTTTKKLLSPLLGLEGYHNIFQTIKDESISIKPIVAIGSVGIEDVELLGKVDGLWGVAVSGAIGSDLVKSKDITEQILDKIELNFKNNG